MKSERQKRLKRVGSRWGMALGIGWIWIFTVVWGLDETVGGGEGEAIEALDLDGHLAIENPRVPTGLELQRGVWKYDCMECHRSLEAKWHLKRPLMEHGEIELKHGNNRFCLNCHHPRNRNAFVDYDGAEISEADVVLLCAKCHGPQHRDWMAGAHGRRNGYWDLQIGDSERLDCINCHDPHDPGFKAMEPLPGPTYPSRAAGSLKNRVSHDEEAEKHG